MIDTGTGASPPWSSTRETACSPIHFQSMISMSSSNKSTSCSTVVDQDNDNVNQQDLMNGMVYHQSVVSFPSSSNGCSNSTPVLSLSTSEPVPLMSIGATDTYGFNSRNISTVPISNINKNHVSGGHWPVDHRNRYDSRYQQHQGRNTHRYKIHQHEHQSHCRKYVRVGRSRMKSFGKVFNRLCQSNEENE